jgi:O-antigen ligase
MFLYAASGIRVGAAGRELKFSFALLTFCEILIYVTASCYFILHYDFFGNPNSLGAVMGVLVAPMMLWGVFASERTPAHERRMLALMLCILLLVTSHARAGMLAAGFSFVLMCITLRRYRALAMVVGTALLAAVIVAFAFPTVTDQHDAGQSLASDFVYKGHPELGILGSRETIWEKTMSSVREHPWLGTGFGTSATGIDVSNDFSSFRSSARSTREHGNSYLATLEWVGIIGVGPFVILVFLIAVNVGRLLVRIRHSGNALSPLVPLVGVVLAGLVNAAFEDWLFAAGYYLCVLFWGLAFVLDDFVYISDQLAAS